MTPTVKAALLGVIAGALIVTVISLAIFLAVGL